ncbi:hypothetical protein N9V16_03145 [SAR116 cluster bacterium]|nr:hypothetical protein [SAR116 cluster bacterium]|tara:strand:+ start:277 stop:654 length:378 start_codon:yes stop_codon:yes gene_type:complete
MKQQVSPKHTPSISEYYMLGPKIELIWTKHLITKYPKRKTRDKIAFEIFSYIDRNYFPDYTDFPSSMKSHYERLYDFEDELKRRPVFTIEAYKKVFLIKFIEIGKSDQYRLEINLTGTNVIKFNK